MNTKIGNISDLYLNYDYTALLNKLQAAEEFDGKIMEAFRKAIAYFNQQDVKYVILSGKLFDGNTILVGEIDEFIGVLGESKRIKFIIAPDRDENDMSWYRVISWPENVSLLYDENDAITLEEMKVVLYRGKLELGKTENDYTKICIVNDKENRNLNSSGDLSLVYGTNKYLMNGKTVMSSTFMPQDFSVENSNGYILIEGQGKNLSAKLIKNDDTHLRLKEIELSSEMTVEEIAAKVKASIVDESGVYYQIVFTGVVNHTLAFDFLDEVYGQVKSKAYLKLLNKAKRDYDVNTIKNENSDNLIGLFIEEVQKDAIDEEKKARVIEYGLDYLL